MSTAQEYVDQLITWHEQQLDRVGIVAGLYAHALAIGRLRRVAAEQWRPRPGDARARAAEPVTSPIYAQLATARGWAVA